MTWMKITKLLGNVKMHCEDPKYGIAGNCKKDKVLGFGLLSKN